MAFRHSKIVCTIGPACSSPRMLARLLRAGMDVARLNFSHSTHEEHARNIAQLRAATVEKLVEIQRRAWQRHFGGKKALAECTLS